MLTGSDELPRALARDWRAASLSAADRAMLDYAVKLTRAPSSVTGEDVEGLRAEGFDDTAILDICQVTSYYNYVNRLADGLGVQLEPRWRPEDLTLDHRGFLAAKAKRARGEDG